MAPKVKHASVNGISLSYLEEGQGEPVVFVHGSISDARAWESQREAVAQRYQYIALTQRYFETGPWSDNGEKYSHATHAEDLAMFIRGLNAGPVHVVGWSYGGAVVLLLAVRHPQVVKSLFVFEPALSTFVTDPRDAKLVGEDRQEMLAPSAQAAKSGDTVAAARLLVDGVNGQPGSFNALPLDRRTMFVDNARTIPLQLALPAPPPISCAQLGQIKVPTAIARGELARPFFRIVAETASSCIPGSLLIDIPKGRHTAPLEVAPAFNDALLGFLERSSRA